jgi:hypothetical protein
MTAWKRILADISTRTGGILQAMARAVTHVKSVCGDDTKSVARFRNEAKEAWLGNPTTFKQYWADLSAVKSPKLKAAVQGSLSYTDMQAALGRRAKRRTKSRWTAAGWVKSHTSSLSLAQAKQVYALLGRALKAGKFE